MPGFFNSKSALLYELLWKKSGPRSHFSHTSMQPASAHVNIHGVKWEITYNPSRGVIEFIPAFIRKTNTGSNIKPSIGIHKEYIQATALVDDIMDLAGLGNLSEEDLEEIDLESIDWNAIDQAIAVAPQERIEELGPAGNKYLTAVLEIKVPRESGLTPSVEMTVAITLLSALTLSAVSILEVEQGDLGTSWDISSNYIRLYLYDTASGGSGLVRLIFDDWANHGGQAIWGYANDILFNSKCCRHYCEQCTLLPRTPEFQVRQGLLDKEVAIRFLSGGGKK